MRAKLVLVALLGASSIMLAGCGSLPVTAPTWPTPVRSPAPGVPVEIRHIVDQAFGSVLSDLQQAILADYVVTDYEYQQAKDAYTQCMYSLGWNGVITDDGAFVTTIIKGHPEERYQSTAEISCSVVTIDWVTAVYVMEHPTPQPEQPGDSTEFSVTQPPPPETYANQFSTTVTPGPDWITIPVAFPAADPARGFMITVMTYAPNTSTPLWVVSVVDTYNSPNAAGAQAVTPVSSQPPGGSEVFTMDSDGNMSISDQWSYSVTYGVGTDGQPALTVLIGW